MMVCQSCGMYMKPMGNVCEFCGEKLEYKADKIMDLPTNPVE